MLRRLDLYLPPVNANDEAVAIHKIGSHTKLNAGDKTAFADSAPIFEKKLEFEKGFWMMPEQPVIVYDDQPLALQQGIDRVQFFEQWHVLFPAPGILAGPVSVQEKDDIPLNVRQDLREDLTAVPKVKVDLVSRVFFPACVVELLFDFDGMQGFEIGLHGKNGPAAVCAGFDECLEWAAFEW